MAARLTAYIVASIVGATFIAGLIVGAQRKTDGPVDLIIVNGRVFTGESGAVDAEAIAVQGNRILAVGSNREIQRLQKPQTTVVDARGGSVLPGFNDANARFVAGAVAGKQIDLTGLTSPAQLAGELQRWAALNPDGWVLGRGGDDAMFDPAASARAQLDALVPGRAVLLTSADGSTAWASSAALETAGIGARTRNPSGGSIEREGRTRRPSGVLHGRAVELLTVHVPPVGRAERVQAVAEATTLAHRYGITSVHDTGGNAEDLDVYADLRQQGALRLRVYAALQAPAEASAANLDALESIRERFPDDPLLKAGAVMVQVESESDPRVLERTAAESAARGWTLIFDVVADQAVDLALNALQTADNKPAGTERELRHRIQIAESLEADDLARLHELGIVPSLHGETQTAGDIVQATSSPLEPEPSRDEPALQQLSENDHVVLGSGWPDQPLEPLTVLEELLADVLADEANPSIRQPSLLARALRAYTRDPAWASYDEGRKGTLREDMLADIVVLSKDLFALPPHRLADAEVAFTIFDGKVVYEREVATTER